MTRSESKYFNTALMMDEALIALLEEKDFEYISVKEICARAGVNRSTFYLHYETVADLLSEAMEYNIRQFREQFSVTAEQFIPTIDNAPLSDLMLVNSDNLRLYLTFIKEHKSLYNAVFKNPACMQVDRQFEQTTENVLVPIMSRFHIPQKEQKYRIGFYIHGCMAVIREWIKQNCDDAVEDIARILIACIYPADEQPNHTPGEQKHG